MRTRPVPALRLALATLLVSGCAGVGEFVWVDELPTSRVTDEATLVWPGDLLGIQVWGQSTLSVRTRVRDDGMITVPFVNDFPAVGMSPAEIAADLQTVLKGYLVDPVVTVNIEEAKPMTVSLLGEVVKAGVYELPRGSGVLKALAMAGGATAFASEDRIFVLREDPLAQKGRRTSRIRLSLGRLSRGEGRAASFALRSGDILIVE